MIILARHGSTKYNEPPIRFRGWSGLPLSATGKMEALKLSKNIAKVQKNFDCIYYSILPRSRMTANLVAGSVNYDGMQELAKPLDWNIGEFEGLVVSENLKKLKKYQQPNKAGTPVPGGEPFNSYVSRTLNFFRDTMEEDEDAIVVVHNRTIRLIKAWLEAGMQGNKFHMATFDTEDDPIPPGGFLILSKDNGKWGLHAN